MIERINSKSKLSEKLKYFLHDLQPKRLIDSLVQEAESLEKHLDEYEELNKKLSKQLSKRNDQIKKIRAHNRSIVTPHKYEWEE